MGIMSDAFWNGCGLGLVFGIFTIIMFAIIYSGHVQERDGKRVEKVKGRILLLSDDPKEIEKFLVDKESVIGVELTNQLLGRLAEIKADKVIDKDWSRRARVAPAEKLEPVEEEPLKKALGGN